MREKALGGGQEMAGDNWDYSVKPITGNEISTTGTYDNCVRTFIEKTFCNNYTWSQQYKQNQNIKI